MRTKHFILATAGHVDHGKSSLVKAITGTDPDRLPEEKARKITIELGFAHLSLPSNEANDVCFSVGVIDVPGHEDFVKNMVAGVGSIDLALLVVAADDGWMAQTEEHLEILIHLGVRRVVVALTKIDLAQSETAAESDVRRHLGGSPFADAAIVRTSIITGAGLDHLKGVLGREFSALEPPRNIGKPRLFVDRAFSFRGVGTVVTGTVSGGEFVRGDPVVVQPRGVRSKIRTAQTHNREVDTALPGTRAAFNLSDIAVSARKKDGISRGDVITRPDLGLIEKSADVLLLLPFRRKTISSAIKHGMRVRVHHGSGNFAARLLSQMPDFSTDKETPLVRLRFDAPVFFFAGDRLIIRDPSQRSTLAGAIVLDPNASHVRVRSQRQLELLEARAHAPDDVRVFVITQLRREHVAVRSALLLQSRFSGIEISEAVKLLIGEGKILQAGEILLDASWWSELRTHAIRFIDAEHAAHPEQRGVPQSRLQSELKGSMPMPQMFEALLDDLCQRGFSRAGDVLHRSDRRPVLSDKLQAAATRIRSVLAEKKFDPPSRAELAPDLGSQQAIRFLRDCGEVVELNGEIVLGKEHFGKMRDSVVMFLQKNNSASTSELRQLLGSSRRVIIPFLERLDREGFTRRIADKRVLAKRS
ncbi:MAG TPA: selenocysteine-specific translation elongation factor [Chthoniobacterales bacterium]